MLSEICGEPHFQTQLISQYKIEKCPYLNYDIEEADLRQYPMLSINKGTNGQNSFIF